MEGEARHAENHRLTTCPKCGSPEASEYDLSIGHPGEAARTPSGTMIACGKCGYQDPK